MNPSLLLIAPPVYDFAVYDLYLKPYSLLRLGHWFKDRGYNVKLLNALDYREPLSAARFGKAKRKANGTGKFFRQPLETPAALSRIERGYARYGIGRDVIREKILQAAPDIILVTSGMTYWYSGVKEVVSAAKELLPGVPVVVGGIYATLCPEHCRKNIPADHVIEGEAFPALSRILEKYSLPTGEGSPDGLMLMDEIYSDSAVIKVNSGCPFRCKYCSSHYLSGPFSPGDPGRAFGLVEKIHRELGTRNFAFYDDALLVRKEDVLIPFLDRIVASGMKLNFYLPNAIHLDFVDEKTAMLMKKAGFRELRIGFESSSSDFHEAMDSKFDISIFQNKIDLLFRAGFEPGAIGLYILAGLPGQEKAEVEESIRFASRFGVNVYLAEYSPVPGSALWEKSVALSSFPIAEEPLTHNNSILPLRWDGFSMEDLRELKKLALEKCRRR